MVRIVLLIALLASLVYMVQHMQPLAEPVPGKVAAGRAGKSADKASEEALGGYYPAVPEALPDVEKGYLFSEKRKIEKEAPMAEVKPEVVEPGPEVLDSVVYTGSLIVGDVRRALVTYQEPAREDAAPVNRRPTMLPRRPGAPPEAAGQSPPQNKQLNQGDRLLGYVLTLVEPNRIVFEKDQQKVEKFLYDRNKKRLAVIASRTEAPPAANPGGVPPEAFSAPEMAAQAAAAMQTSPGAGAATMQSNRMVRRSQRLSGLDTGIRVPAMPVPGRPVPNN